MTETIIIVQIIEESMCVCVSVFACIKRAHSFIICMIEYTIFLEIMTQLDLLNSCEMWRRNKNMGQSKRANDMLDCKSRFLSYAPTVPFVKTC